MKQLKQKTHQNNDSGFERAQIHQPQSFIHIYCTNEREYENFVPFQLLNVCVVADRRPKIEFN